MESEKELNAPDLGSTAAIGLATVAMNQLAKGGPKWLRWLTLFFTVVIVLAVGAGVIDKVASIGKLPACDAQTTRDTLSDLNKQNKVNASAYNFIKNTSTTDTQVTCRANLALRDGGTLEYDYRIYKDGAGIRVQITDSRGP